MGSRRDVQRSARGEGREARGHLLKLEAERALAASSRVAEISAYMADLELEIEAARRLYAAAAVTEIATLRAELSGAEVG